MPGSEVSTIPNRALFFYIFIFAIIIQVSTKGRNSTVRKFRPIFILLFASVLLPAAEPTQDKVWGALDFGIGPSSEPVLWRGQGRPEHYRATLNLNVETGKWLFDLTSVAAGAATFDNFDRTDFAISATYRVRKNWRVGLLLEDHSGLNNFMPDPHARTPKSSINATWATVAHDLKRESFFTSVYGGVRLRGDVPVFSPVGDSKPYETEFVGAYFARQLPAQLKLEGRAEGYGNVTFNKAQFLFSPAVSRYIYHHRLVAGIEGVFHFNEGLRPWQVPKPSMEYDPKRLALFLSIPFGRH